MLRAGGLRVTHSVSGSTWADQLDTILSAAALQRGFPRYVVPVVFASQVLGKQSGGAAFSERATGDGHTALDPTQHAFVFLAGFANDVTLAHEIGHVLGLGHSVLPRRLMYFGKLGQFGSSLTDDEVSTSRKTLSLRY